MIIWCSNKMTIIDSRLEGSGYIPEYHPMSESAVPLNFIIIARLTFLGTFTKNNANLALLRIL